MDLQDPHHEAEHLKMFFPVRGTAAFQCLKPTRFTQTTSQCEIICEKNPCEQRCQETAARSFEVQADNCEADIINIYSSLSWATQVGQKSDHPYGDTWISEFLAAADFFIVPSGVFEIVFVMPPAPMSLVDENGDEKTIEAVRVLLDYKQTPTSPATSFDLILDLGQRGVDQILYFGFSNSHDYFLQKWGLLK